MQFAPTVVDAFFTAVRECGPALESDCALVPTG